MLETGGLNPQMAERYPRELSGGQKQRVNIARALLPRPKGLVADETTATLDVSIQADILNLHAGLRQPFALAFSWITHDLAVASHVSGRIAEMYLGQFVEISPASAVGSHAAHPDTRAPMSAEPEVLQKRLHQRKRMALQGEMPSPALPPPDG